MSHCVAFLFRFHGFAKKISVFSANSDPLSEVTVLNPWSKFEAYFWRVFCSSESLRLRPGFSFQWECRSSNDLILFVYRFQSFALQYSFPESACSHGSFSFSYWDELLRGDRCFWPRCTRTVIVKRLCAHLGFIESPFKSADSKWPFVLQDLCFGVRDDIIKLELGFANFPVLDVF